MSQEQKNITNDLLSSLYHTAFYRDGKGLLRCNSNGAARELIGAIEALTATGHTINGYDEKGNLVSCPSI